MRLGPGAQTGGLLLAWCEVVRLNNFARHFLSFGDLLADALLIA